VGHYRRLDTAGEVRWVDIDLDPEALSSHGLKPAAAMRRLHALDHEGRMVSGVYAFLAIWRRLPYYRHLARIVETLRLAPLLDLIYARFADWRFRRRCGSGACAIDP
jgi:predicted DCC family thiol-disulfide oxidoreductase YuxK